MGSMAQPAGSTQPPAFPQRRDRQNGEAQDLAFFLHRADQRLGQAPLDLPFVKMTFGGPEMSSEQRGLLRARATVALNLGDPVKRAVAVERAAIGMLRHVHERITAGTLDAGDWEAHIDISDARVLAAAALTAALDYLGGKERV